MSDFTLPPLDDYPMPLPDDVPPDAPIPFRSLDEMALAIIYFQARFLVETNTDSEIVNPALRILTLCKPAFDRLPIYADGLSLMEQYQRITGVDLDEAVQHHKGRRTFTPPREDDAPMPFTLPDVSLPTRDDEDTQGDDDGE